MIVFYWPSNWPGLPVLIVDGFMDYGRIHVWGALEHFYHLPKPFAPDELLGKVSDVLPIVPGTARQIRGAILC